MRSRFAKQKTSTSRPDVDARDSVVISTSGREAEKGGKGNQEAITPINMVLTSWWVYVPRGGQQLLWHRPHSSGCALKRVVLATNS